MKRRALSIMLLAVVAAACGSPLENAVSTFVEQVSLGDPAAQQTYSENRELLESAEAIPIWVSQLDTSESAQVRNWAATILGNIGDDAALQALAGAMSDSSREVRDAAIAAIGKFDADTAANTFADALESGSRDAQATALVALARMGAGAGPAIPAVAQAAGASESLISNTAINTLGDIATPEAAAALGELARDMDLGMDYRKQAIQSLQRIGGEVAAGELQQVSDALADEDGADDLRALLQ